MAPAGVSKIAPRQAMPQHPAVEAHRLPMPVPSPKRGMLELFDAVAEHAIEEVQAAPLSRLRPGLAFDLRHGPVGRGFEAQLRPGFGDAGDDGNTQRGKVGCQRQVLGRQGRCVCAPGLEKGDQSRTLQLLVAQSLLRQVAQGREPLGRSRLCPRLRGQVLAQPAAQQGHAEGIACAGGGQKPRGHIARRAAPGMLLHRGRHLRDERAHRGLRRALPRRREFVSGRAGAVNCSIEPGERCAGQGKRCRSIEAHQIDQTGRVPRRLHRGNGARKRIDLRERHVFMDAPGRDAEGAAVELQLQLFGIEGHPVACARRCA